jgi:phage terminase large subunit-like protein
MGRKAGRPSEASRLVAQAPLEKNLWEFAKFINPHYMYGDIHEKVFSWLSKKKCSDHQLLLMPRAHLKSHCIAVWCVWQITRDPTSTIVYLSSGEDLAKAQVHAIKMMITCDQYRKMWPKMVGPDEGKREKWSAYGFNVDHPKRKEMGIRDMTITVKTVKSNAVGLHCSHLVLDDVVVPKFAHTELGRKDLQSAVAYYASIKNPGAYTKAVGTIYDPSDLYSDFIEARSSIWDEEERCFTGDEPLWDVKTFVAEDNGDGTGNFLWPREVNPKDGKGYGFDIQTLAKIRDQYFSTGQHAEYFSQYYNEPNDPSLNKINREDIQYYDPKFVEFDSGVWTFNGDRLNIFAAMDVAWTTSKSSDYTAIAVVGIDCINNIYILDVDRFKTASYTVYYDHIIGMHHKWGLRKLRIETNSGGQLVSNEIKRLLRENGSSLSIDAKYISGTRGKKIDRIDQVLIPRISNGSIWFAKGGLTSILLEEIILEHPPHDDLKDALSEAIIISHPPGKRSDKVTKAKTKVRYNGRFGGRIR